MSRRPRYSPRVRALFSNPVHAGTLDGPGASACRGATTIELSAELQGGRLVRLAFRALGAPEVIAAAELFCEEFEGRPAPALAEFAAGDVMKKLEIPVEKTGLILLLEDAVRALSTKTGAGSPHLETKG